MAMIAFLFPLRAAKDQNFPDNHVFRIREMAHATSQSVVLICGFPFIVRVLFFYRHFHDCLVIHLPKRIDAAQKGIGSFRYQSLR